jgi:O-antigen/teichoic acid export membrane protein
MEIKKQYSFFYVGLGLLSFIADIVTLGEFIYNKKITNFFAPQWYIGLGLVIFLCIAGFVFLNISKNDIAKTIALFYGIIFQSLAAICYLYFGHKQLFTPNSLPNYIGFSLLFLLFLIIATFALKKGESIIISSFFWSISSLIIAFMMVYKYVFKHSPFDMSVLIGEAVILSIGSILFLVTYYSRK